MFENLSEIVDTIKCLKQLKMYLSPTGKASGLEFGGLNFIQYTEREDKNEDSVHNICFQKEIYLILDCR